MFKRIKRLYKLSKKDQKAVEELLDDDIDDLPDEGDGSAVFFGDGSTEEFEEMKKEDNGLKGWYDRLNKL